MAESEEAPEGATPPGDKSADVQPLAFTIQFHDRKVDGSRQSKIHERLSSFALKHRRNPSLPDFNVVKNERLTSPTEKLPSPLNSHHVPILKALHKSVNSPEANNHHHHHPSPPSKKWEDKFKSGKVPGQSKTSPVAARKGPLLPSVNGIANDNFSTYLKKGRRSSLNDIDSRKISCQDVPIKVEFKVVANDNGAEKHNDADNKSDTVSEAGTYTVDKDDKEKEKSPTFEESDEEPAGVAKESSSFHHKWINDWVSKVAEQNLLLHPVDPPQMASKSSGSGSSSPGRSKIPSPVNTLARLKARQMSSEEKASPRLNGNFHHRRSSSLSAKDYSENRASDSSLETESFLRMTESVVTAMQNRMRLSADARNSDPRKSDRREYKEKPHPPSTASDTDTNSECEGKMFKKPLGNPFTSARLNRAFSLRRAKAEPEGEKKAAGKDAAGTPDGKKGGGGGSARSTPSPGTVKSKPPMTTPFSRTDCGRFSMRSTVTVPKYAAQKKDAKKSASTGTANGRSSSSCLSSREVEFQNWKRRKNFDPMKAAAEGRKKELAKKAAAMSNQSMTQSINLGIRARSGNPVLRSASFHSTPQTLVSDEEEEEEEEEAEEEEELEEGLHRGASVEEQEEAAWSARPRTSPTRQSKNAFARPATFSSRCSLTSVVSETHSSPSHRVRSEVLDNLVMTAINDLSRKLKIKSCTLLKKLHYVYEADEERSFRLREEISALESRRESNPNSPIHQTASRDLSTILKNLKSLENVLKLLDDVLFDDSVEVYVEN